MVYKKNRENQFKIGENTLAAGVYDWSPSVSTDTDKQEYYDGSDELTVLKVEREFTFRCHDGNADAAAKAVWGMKDATGDDCIVSFTWTDTDGTSKVCDNSTIYDVNPLGGSANGKSGFEFKVHLASTTSEE